MTYKDCFTLARTQPVNGDAKPRFFVDGVRVARSYYETLEENALRSDCFHTRSNKKTGGFVHYKNVYLN